MRKIQYACRWPHTWTPSCQRLVDVVKGLLSQRTELNAVSQGTSWSEILGCHDSSLWQTFSDRRCPFSAIFMVTRPRTQHTMFWSHMLGSTQQSPQCKSEVTFRFCCVDFYGRQQALLHTSLYYACRTNGTAQRQAEGRGCIMVRDYFPIVLLPQARQQEPSRRHWDKETQSIIMNE